MLEQVPLKLSSVLNSILYFCFKKTSFKKFSQQYSIINQWFHFENRHPVLAVKFVSDSSALGVSSQRTGLTRGHTGSMEMASRPQDALPAGHQHLVQASSIRAPSPARNLAEQAAFKGPISEDFRPTTYLTHTYNVL